MHDVWPAIPDDFPVLEAGDAVLRRLEPADAEAFYRRGSDPEVAGPQMGSVMTDPGEATAAIEGILEGFRTKRMLRWAIELPGSPEAVGTVGYNDFFAFHQRAEIGYALDRSFWGQGVMSASVQAIVDYGFETLGLHRVEAIIAEGNTRSSAVAERCGFHREGTLRDFFRTPGGWADAWFYGVVRSD